MFRPTPRRPSKPHSHCVLPRSPGRENSRVRSNVWTFSPSDILKAVSGQSFSLQSITDSPSQRQSTISSFFNDLRTLFIATEGIPPVPFWNSPSFLSPQHYPISVQALTGAHSTNLFVSYSSRSGWCTPHSITERCDVPTCGRSDKSVRPIAAYAHWCHNPQRHQISFRSGETTPLSPVSNDSRADIGNLFHTLPVTDSDSIGVASRA